MAQVDSCRLSHIEGANLKDMYIFVVPYIYASFMQLRFNMLVLNNKKYPLYSTNSFHRYIKNIFVNSKLL